MRPICIDLFCGLGGWTEAFMAEGYRCIGFDIEAHDYGTGGYPGELVVRDVRSITGKELVQTHGEPAVIVASPPCQEFSYMAMPWSKAKEKMRKILADPAEQIRLCELFNQCFRIQREVSEACGRYVPLVVENVRGAQRWVGKSKWNFGSFHLWGDVPALMPSPSKAVLKQGIAHRSNGATNFHGYKGEGNKTVGMNWSDQTKRGQDFTRVAGLQVEGVKGGDKNGYDYAERTFGWKAPSTTSKSDKRKKASAEIAKIPFTLASWIARVYKPKTDEAAPRPYQAEVAA